MADPTGFLKYPRAVPTYRPVEVRTLDFCDVTDEQSFTPNTTQEQAARCMGCGVPFCHDACPLGNLIPAFNDAVQRENWQQAYRLLQETNYFPEFTGRICPAPCEHACVLGINQPAVAIEHIERTISDIAFEKGYVKAQIPTRNTGKKVAIVGAGPAGLAAAQHLNRQGHHVTVFEKDTHPGGLLRFGIPDFKLEKWIVERRIALLEAEGVYFQCNTNVGVDITGADLCTQHDAVLLCVGAAHARPLSIPGADYAGVYPAMDYLTQSNRRVAGNLIPKETIIHARGKHVVVIGGGDTGSDCVGTANRQGALSVTQLQYRTRPPETRPSETPWPLTPMIFQTSSSHEEGCDRMFEVQTKALVAHENGQVKGLLISNLAWERDPETGKYQFQEIPGSEREIPCDLVLIAIGYNGVVPNPLWAQLGIQMNEKSCIPDLGNFHTQQEKVFVAGDARRGQSLVVWAIAEGRDAGIAMDQYLQKKDNI